MHTSVNVKKLIIDLLEHHGSHGLSKNAVTSGGTSEDFHNNRSLYQHERFRAGRGSRSTDCFSAADIGRAFDALLEEKAIICNEPDNPRGKKTYRLPKFPTPQESHNELAELTTPAGQASLAQRIADAITKNELKAAREVSDAYLHSLLARNEK